MTETRLGVITGVALTIVGAIDFARHQNVGTVGGKVMLVVEIAAIIAGIVSLFWWARLREAKKRASR